MNIEILIVLLVSLAVGFALGRWHRAKRKAGGGSNHGRKPDRQVPGP